VGTIILVQTSQNTVFRLVEDPENEWKIGKKRSFS
jgi:hypothetical protein